MPERLSGFLGFVDNRLRGRELPAEVHSRYLRYIEQYLRFHNQAPQADRLAELPATQALDAYMAWLERETQVDDQSVQSARSAIELLYSDVFRIPLSRS